MPTGKTARRRAMDRRLARLQDVRNEGDPDVYGISYKINGRYNRPELRWLVDRDPMVALMALREVRIAAAGVERDLVVGGRRAGFSWEDLAWCLGLTRTALMKRHPDLDDEVFA